MLQAIDEIGFTPYHLKLFFLNGFGFVIDLWPINFQNGKLTNERTQVRGRLHARLLT